MITTNTQTHYRTCNLCEAMCGVKIQHDGQQVLSIKGDENDPFSQGHICPKAVALQDLYEDQDRLTTPMERTENGWQTISWSQALEKAAAGLKQVQTQYGDNALGVYLGNPNVHNLGSMLTIKSLLSALNSRNRFSATSVDQLPHHIVAHHLFGHQLRIPVPDINRCEHMLIIGANPVASNGSIMSVAGVKHKLKAISKNGGKVVVIDPRRSETAALADEHHFIRPASDAWLLLAMVNYIFSHNKVRPSKALDLCDDLDGLKQAVAPYDFKRAESYTGLSVQQMQSLTEAFCQADNAVCYGRMGVSVQAFGLLSQYLIMMINILTGRLDAKGGLMFPAPAADVVAASGPGYFNKRQSRVRNLPDFNGEFPSATLADEILSEGEGQIKAMFTVAGNPVLSTPNGKKLDEALGSLDFMVCVDFYLNETTRHANIILPPVSPLQRDHYDMSFNNLAVHNTAKYSPVLFKKSRHERHDWQIYLGLVRRLKRKRSWTEKMMQGLTSLLGPNIWLNHLIKSGPYQGLTLSKIKQHRHGLDLGPLQSALPAVLKHKDKQIHVNADFYLADLTRLQQSEQQDFSDPQQALLIGRRHVRSNNSWMHNSHRLVKGKERCTLMLHPEHGQKLNIEQGSWVTVTSRSGQVSLQAQLTDELMPGVVSIPHGWGHHRQGMRLTTASKHAGVSVNDVTDEQLLDELSGNAAVNGVPVSLSLMPSKTQNINSFEQREHGESRAEAVG